MNITMAINFGLSALNFGCMVWGIMGGSQLWWLNLAAGVFCLCMGVACND